MKFTLQQLYARAEQRPPGYVKEVLSLSTVTGDIVELPDADYEELKAKYRSSPRPEPMLEPSLTELAQNFSLATARWAAAGFPVVTPDIYEMRSSVCETCDLWDGTARLGLGKCKAPGCGCTRFKRWLATERCVMGKWKNRSSM